jgi:FkbM family methyltransferase
MLLPISSMFASEAFITNGNVDWGSEALLYALMPQGGTFLDVGANIGYYTLYMLPKAGAVYAFEPDPRMRKTLEFVLDNRKSVEIMSNAVGHEDGKAIFTLESAGEVSHLADDRTSDSSQNIEVNVITLDSFVSERHIDNVGAVKIDVEGFDFFVVAGSTSIMKSQRPVILTEARPEGRLFDIIEATNYGVWAYVKAAVSRRLAFIQIHRGEIYMHNTKMIFLLPLEKSSEALIAAKKLTFRG